MNGKEQKTIPVDEVPRVLKRIAELQAAEQGARATLGVLRKCVANGTGARITIAVGDHAVAEMTSEAQQEIAAVLLNEIARLAKSARNLAATINARVS